MSAPGVGEMACREFVELVTDYLEGALPAAERARFEAHLADCDDCPRYLEQIRATVRLVGRLAPGTPVDGMASLLAHFRDWRRTRP